MAQIYNSDLIKEVIDGAKIQIAHDNFPNQLAEKVVPVMEVNPKLLRTISVVKHNNILNSSSATIYTTPVGKSFYITAAILSMQKDATSISKYCAITIDLPDGTTSQRLLNIAGLSTTALNNAITISFPIPILIKENSAINVVTEDISLGNVIASGSIFGYLVDNPKA